MELFIVPRMLLQYSLSSYIACYTVNQFKAHFFGYEALERTHSSLGLGSALKEPSPFTVPIAIPVNVWCTGVEKEGAPDASSPEQAPDRAVASVDVSDATTGTDAVAATDKSGLTRAAEGDQSMAPADEPAPTTVVAEAAAAPSQAAASDVVSSENAPAVADEAPGATGTSLLNGVTNDVTAREAETAEGSVTPAPISVESAERTAESSDAPLNGEPGEKSDDGEIRSRALHSYGRRKIKERMRELHGEVDSGISKFFVWGDAAGARQLSKSILIVLKKDSMQTHAAR